VQTQFLEEEFSFHPESLDIRRSEDIPESFIDRGVTLWARIVTYNSH